jgi:hypothetical protein
MAPSRSQASCLMLQVVFPIRSLIVLFQIDEPTRKQVTSVLSQVGALAWL